MSIDFIWTCAVIQANNRNYHSLKKNYVQYHEVSGEVRLLTRTAVHTQLLVQSSKSTIEIILILRRVIQEASVWDF